MNNLNTQAVTSARQPQQRATSATNIKRIEQTVNAILEEVEKIKTTSMYSVDVPDVEAVFAAITKGNQTIKRVIASKNEQENCPKNTARITKSFAKLASLLDSADIADSDSKHLISALTATSRDLSSHINMIKRKSEKSNTFTF